MARHREQQRDKELAPKKVLTNWDVGASGPQGPSAPFPGSEIFQRIRVGCRILSPTSRRRRVVSSSLTQSRNRLLSSRIATAPLGEATCLVSDRPRTAPWGQGLVSSRDVPCQNLPMEADGFWNILESAGPGECSVVASAIQANLEQLPQQEIADFCRIFDSYMDALYSWDLWGVAYILNGGCSDDGFEYFRAWVLSEGRSVTELALSDSEGFGLSVSPDTEPDEMECEDLIYAGRSAYKTLTGNFGPPRAAPQPAAPSGEEWEESTAGLRSRFPRLAAHWGMA